MDSWLRASSPCFEWKNIFWHMCYFSLMICLFIKKSLQLDFFLCQIWLHIVLCFLWRHTNLFAYFLTKGCLLTQYVHSIKYVCTKHIKNHYLHSATHIKLCSIVQERMVSSHCGLKPVLYIFIPSMVWWVFIPE